MDADMIQNRWLEIKNEIHSTWGKFKESDLEGFRGNLEGLVTKLQHVYGYANGQAEREYHEFRVSIRPILRPLVPTSRSPERTPKE